MKGRLWRWESLFMGALLGNLGWAHLLGLRDMAEGGSGEECLSPWGSVKGTWREGPLSGDPAEYLEKALETGISLHRSSSTGVFESWMKGPLGWGIALSRGSMEGASGRAPLPGNLKDEVFEKYTNAL
jgi:hypothetical protein